MMSAAAAELPVIPGGESHASSTSVSFSGCRIEQKSNAMTTAATSSSAPSDDSNTMTTSVDHCGQGGTEGGLCGGLTAIETAEETRNIPANRGNG